MTEPTRTAAARQPLLEVRDLAVSFRGQHSTIRAVNNLSFSLMPGEALGLVGESGSGKSVGVAALLGLLGPTARVTSGSAIFEGRDLLRLGPRDLRQMRGGRIGMVFQDPLNSFNPVLRIGFQIDEMLRAHGRHAAPGRHAQVVSLLQLMGIRDAERVAGIYPHQLSGGMRQRAMIAMAVASQPTLLIADEPTTALDVTIQAQILEYFRRLRAERQMALLLITHDLEIVAGTTERVAVMYAGRIVETGPTREVLAHPRHPYTRGLLRSLPRLDRPRLERLQPIEGNPPDPSRPIEGCPFKPRCPSSIQRCDADPGLEWSDDRRAVACWVDPHRAQRTDEAKP